VAPASSPSISRTDARAAVAAVLIPVSRAAPATAIASVSALSARRKFVLGAVVFWVVLH